MAMTTITRIITPMIEPLALMRLLQLASPMLPVGAYAYSQGLEAAIEAGDVHDAETASAWIADVLEFYLVRFELPVLSRLYRTLATAGEARAWNEFFLTGRDTAEAHAETLQMGYSLQRLLRDLAVCDEQLLASLEAVETITFPTAYAAASVAYGIPLAAALQAYAWSWLENQVSVAMKAIPIGQVAGQRILLEIGSEIPDAVTRAMALDDDDISTFLPGLALAGCRHESQYSRLFRS
jgi:urease accessory protein